MPSGSLPPGEEAGLPCRSAWYVDTALHQAVTPNADFQFVNIGRWQTAEDFQTATQSPGFRESAARLAGVPAASGPCWLVGLEAIGPGLPPARERDHHQVSRSGQRGGCEAGWVLAGWLDMTGAAGLALPEGLPVLAPVGGQPLRQVSPQKVVSGHLRSSAPARSGGGADPSRRPPGRHRLRS
jgi:hypothetical protein